MRLGTFNLMHGRSLGDGLVVPDRLRAAVVELRADILGIQEADAGQPRSGHVDQTTLVAEAMGAAYHQFAPTLSGTPGVDGQPYVDTPDGPRYGIGLVSRWPVRSWQVLPLPVTRAPAPIYVPGPDGGLIWLRDEPRTMLVGVVESPAGALTVATTHLSFVPGWNIRQLAVAARALRRLPGPHVLLGDLNLPATVLRAVTPWRALARRATYPSPRPRVQFDHVLVGRGEQRRLVVHRVDTPLVPVSDHRPLVVEFTRNFDS